MAEIDYKQAFEQLQESVISREVERAFSANGGRQPQGIPSADSPHPAQLVRHALKELRLVDGVVGVVGGDGELKPLSQAIAAMKQPGSGYENFFGDSPTPQAQASPNVKTVSRAEVARGRVSIDAIVRGEIVVGD